MTIQKQIVADKRNQPVAVVIDYSTWLEIERLLAQRPAVGPTDISDLYGTIHLTEDPLEYQRRIRDEW